LTRSAEMRAGMGPLDELEVPAAVLAREVAQQAGAGRDHLEQAALGGVVVLVGLEVLGERPDAVGQDRDLDLGAARVFGVALVFFDDFLTLLGGDAHVF